MKIKDHIQKVQEKENELDWSFEEWLDYFNKDLTSDELTDMERQRRSNYDPINNKYYQPKQGA